MCIIKEERLVLSVIFRKNEKQRAGTRNKPSLSVCFSCKLFFRTTVDIAFTKVTPALGICPSDN